MTEPVTAEEYRIMMGQAKAPKVSKYRNKPVMVGDERFDSKKEAQRWHELNLELKAGRITKLRRQVPFSLSVNGEHIAKYIADFVYEREGVRRVEDAKGVRTEVYVIKRKLMLACNGIEVIES